MNLIHDLPTPVLLLNWSLASRNIARAAAYVKDKSVRLRPHFKNHKCVQLAKAQLAAGGCVGMTTATLDEAQALAMSGVKDILIANQFADPARIPQLIEVARLTRLRVLVDNEQNAYHLSKAFESTGIDLGVLLELDIGSHRCGAEPGEKAAKIAGKFLVNQPGLRFDGLHAYHGHAVNMTDKHERTTAARQSMQLAVDTRRLIESKGIECPILTGGGSSTYAVIGQMAGVDELQIGTYVTMDCSYKHRAPEFEPALTVLATVISCATDRFVVNAGVKAVAHEFGPPEVLGHP